MRHFFFFLGSQGRQAISTSASFVRPLITISQQRNLGNCKVGDGLGIVLERKSWT